MYRAICALTTLTFLSSTGCATIFHDSPQTVTIITSPRGEHVFYQGRKIRDGDVLTVSKHFEAPRLNVGEPRRPILIEMRYDPDGLLIVDAALLFLGVIPGVIALSVDIGTGAWRRLHHTQHVNVPERAPQEQDVAE